MSKYKMIPDGIIASQIALLQDLYEQYIGYKTDGYFVEIGAFNGWNWSNTACLIDAGWSGIMVGPNPDLFNELNGRHGNKSKLKLLQLAVGDHDGTAKLYLGGSLSTVKTKSMLEYCYIQGMNYTGLGEDKYVVVGLLTMDSLLSSCMCPTRYDVLVVDVEGAEVVDRWRGAYGDRTGCEDRLDDAAAVCEEQQSMEREATLRGGRRNVQRASVEINPGARRSPRYVSDHLCAVDGEILKKSRAALKDEFDRCERLGIDYLNFHPGSHMGAGEADGIKRIAESLKAIHEQTKHYHVRSVLETTAGQGTAIGYRFEHLREIIDRVESSDRMAVCIDTMPHPRRRL